jgi:ATP-binding cassette subfamily A (ABC1) protein 3
MSHFRWKRTRPVDGSLTGDNAPDILAESRRVASSDDPLRVLSISKRFKGAPSPAVNDVSFGVGIETLGLLGPNGAGKTTTFNIIRKLITPQANLA